MREHKNIAWIIDHYGLDISDLIVSRVNGRSVANNPGACQIPVVYPVTGETVCHLQEAGQETVADAVAAARTSFQSRSWRGLPSTERQAIMRNISQTILEYQDELAALECLGAGLPLKHLRGRQLPRAAENFIFFAELLSSPADSTFQPAQGYQTTVTRDPAGVAALFSPYNAPLAVGGMQIAACLAFGNSCVVKPSEHAPLALFRLVELIESAGVPEGVVNLVNGRGPVTGKELASTSGVDRISFTGRSETGRLIMRAAAQNLVPVYLGLSARSANIVMADANFEQALDGSLLNSFGNSGQMCVAGSRILIQKPLAKRFIESFVKRTRNLAVGDPIDPETEVGPLGFRDQRDRVLDYIRVAEEEGADILCGGVDSPYPDGFFVQPTVARVKDNSVQVCQEEIFGPFATIQVFDDLEEAIQIANDSRFGLTAYAWTEDPQQANRLQQDIRAGTVFVNTPLVRDLRAPFGGVGESGLGREGPTQWLDFYTETKTSIVATRPVTIPILGKGDG